MFSDPDCPYCRHLERETLDKLDDVTIYTFLFPLDHHPDAARKTALIWRAADRSRAWNDWMLRGRLPAGAADCAPPAANLALGQALGVRGTPTVVLDNGEVLVGAVDRAVLEEKWRR